MILQDRGTVPVYSYKKPGEFWKDPGRKSWTSNAGQAHHSLIIYDTPVDHSKIMHRILYDWCGAILWTNYDQSGRETWEVFLHDFRDRGQK